MLDGVLRRRRPLDEQLDDQAIGLARWPSATARWSAIWSARCCAGSARCGICSAAISIAACRPTRRGSKPRCCSAPRRSCCLDVPDHAAVDLSVRLVQADRRATRYAGLVNAVLRRVARDGAQQLAGIDTAPLDTPDWLMPRWIEDLRRGPGARHRGRQPPGAGARSLGEGRSGRLGRTARRPRAADRLGARRGARAGAAAAGLRRGRLVGAGRRRGAAGAAARRRARPHGRRPLRRARRQDRAARRRRRARHRGRPRAQAARAAAAKSGAPRSRRRDRRRRRHRNGAAGRSTPCCSMRRARRPARSGAIPTFPGSSARAISRRSRPCSGGCWPSAVDCVKPGGTLVYCTCSLEPEEGIDMVRNSARGEPRACAGPIAGGEVSGQDDWLTPEGDLRTLPCHWPIPIRAWPASTASMPPVSQGFEELTAVGRPPALRYLAGSCSGSRLVSHCSTRVCRRRNQGTPQRMILVWWI